MLDKLFLELKYTFAEVFAINVRRSVDVNHNILNCHLSVC